MMRVARANERYRSEQPGVESWHCFAAGGNYEAGNLSFGAMNGCDEHLIAPGAGFDWHAHRAVDIVSWVLSGTLRHEDAAGRVRLVEPGQALLQSTGTGIRHCEMNASASEPLRLVQMTVLGDSHDPFDQLSEPPLTVGDFEFQVWSGVDTARWARWHVFAASGEWHIDDAVLRAGDSARGLGALNATGEGELLVWKLG